MPAETLESLTPREREVLTYVAQGLSLPEIAQKLHRSLKTIETHRLSLGRKLDASNRVELTRIAIASGLAPLEVSIEDTKTESAKNAAVRRELEGRARALKFFQQINDEVFSATGPTFLRRLVLSMSRVLGVQTACVSTLSYNKGDQILYALALCNQGVMLDPETFIAQCTPCEDVLLTGHACYIGGLSERFPEDRYLEKLGKESYIGVRLEDQQGGALGTMSVLDDKPIENGAQIETILRMFAPRIAAELAQLAISDRVRELTEDLESEVEKRTQELGRATSIFHSLVSRSTDGFCGVDSDGLVTLVNPSLAEVLGREVGDMVGKMNIVELVHPDDLDDFQTHRYEQTRQRTNRYRIRLINADDQAVAFDVTSHAQVDDSGSHLGCFAVLTPDNES
ncbi:LuxR C-terminal-related transcriptional regulator [Phycisphaeraceae bacterium D3-23]